MDTATTDSIEALGAAIRARRKLLRLTQQQLADLAAVGVVFIHEAEQGKATMQLDKLLQVLEALGLQLRLTEGSPSLKVPS